MIVKETASAAKRVSYFFIAIIFVLFTLSFISLFQAFETYRKTGATDYITVTLSASAIALSSYLAIQARQKPMKLGFEPLKVFTTVQCSNCDHKNTREFQNGDFILKKVELCPKCNIPTFISSIYREATAEEEKK
jgi:hypothetical protein